MKHSEKRIEHQKSQKGQSFVELSLVVVFLMIFVAGIVEFGFMLNNYLNMVDASREAVRYSSNFDPFDENGDLDPQFFIDTGTLTQDVLSPVELDPAMGDDIVISFFSIGDGIYVRYPNPQGWSVLGTQTTKFSDTDIQNRLDSSAPPTGVLIVEIFYNYPQVLKLPVFTAFVSDPMPVYVYSVMPLTAAEPIDGGGPSGGGGGGGGATSTPGDTPVPSATPIPSNTPVPTNTLIPTNTPTPTATTFVCDVVGSDFYIVKKKRVYVDITNNTNIKLNYSNITLFFNDGGSQKLEKVKNDGSTLWSGSDTNSPFSKSIGGDVDPGETSTLKFYFDKNYSFSGNEVLNLEFEESDCLTLSIK